MISTTRKRGFTIIELILAMTAISVLLVVIVVLVMNINSMFRQGIALRETNSAARAIIDDIMRTTAGSPGLPMGAAFGRTHGAGAMTEGGVFCTGSYSYVWKHARRLRGDLGNPNGGMSVNGITNFRLLKARDAGRDMCNPALGMALVTPTGEPPQEVISAAEIDLALYDFRVFVPRSNTTIGQSFYTVSFVLGTLRGTNLEGGRVGREACVPPALELGFDFDYCAVNRFNFAVRAAGGG
ncbi:prepilin-type N-terminal cleavage/methylation domain-containing protein [Candidatus Saccharibacteria bacterium]|nr:prepilin-type N-terminal cleavage/methylation domain-containing protein [Candidatus Saccharibacteria bacterium]